ncbi:MAG: hypothetical protein RBU30_14010, partial [Polyangia bacterium]|nr:hypothetical protein [Polyangia bacterium]
PEICDTLDNDCNGLVNDGLDEGGADCGAGVSIPLPDRPENGTNNSVSGTITQGDVDWYAITFTDAAGYPNAFNIRLALSSNAGVVRMDVLKNNCSTPITCGSGTNLNITELSWNAFGETSSACSGGAQPCPASHTQTLYIKVYKIGGSVCEPYTLTATNG